MAVSTLDKIAADPQWMRSKELHQTEPLMSLFAIPYPMIDPIAFELGPVTVRWYGLAYMAGLLLGWYYIRRLIQEGRLWRGGKSPVTDENIDDLLLWITLSIVIGGRLGFVLLYQPSYFLANPMEVLAVWHGGMSFHGALLGSCLAGYLFARRHKIPFFSVADLLSAAVPIGLFLGRIANFINSEHFGRPTDVDAQRDPEQEVINLASSSKNLLLVWVISALSLSMKISILFHT